MNRPLRSLLSRGAAMSGALFAVFAAVSSLLIPPHAHAADASYRLNPGDDLEVTVWGDTRLDRETLVLPDGTISFPLIDPMKVSGLTVDQVAAAIAKELSDRKEVAEANVSVVVKAALGNVVDVIGQVTKPGELQAGHNITIMQALSLAGGLTPYAAEHRISILRRQPDGSDISIPFPYYNALLDGRKLDKDVELVPGDVVVVPAATLF